jgi:cobalt-zinc-cadmium efflux system outer membrane protein
MQALDARWLLPFALLISVGAPGRVRARPIGFRDARAGAERAAPDLQVAARRVDVSRAQVEVAGTLANPTLTVLSATRSARLTTSVSIPLPLFGQRGTAMAAARADADVSVQDATLVQSEVRFGATLGWIELWEAQQRARLLGLAAQDAERLLAIANERFEAGTGPRVDVVRTHAGHARARAELISADAAVRAASMRLAPWLGERIDEPGAELSAEGELGFPSALPELLALQRWQAEHPALLRDQAQIRAAQARVRAEQRLRWPIVNAELGSSQFDRTNPGPPDFIGGLSFEVPLLSQRGGAISRARSEQALAVSESDADLLHLRAALVAAYREAEGAAAQLAALRDEVVPALVEARQMTEESYRSGRVDLIRLLETQRALLDSQLGEVAAVAAFGRALAELERATGRRLDVGVADAR